MSRSVTFIEVDSALEYDLGPEHPFTPLRRRLAADLIRAYGALEEPGVTSTTASAARDDQIARVHAPEYVAAVRRLGSLPDGAQHAEAGVWGLSETGDTPAFPGMHEAASAVCGGALTAALAVASGASERAFTVAGGLHHALVNRAAGFCIYNDCAVAIQALLDRGVERVAYVDIDAHHGDGTQWIFYEDPRVLTVSVHESGRYVFPGTGGLGERGSGAGVGTAANVPLPPLCGDGPWLSAIEHVVVPLVRAFAPEVIVTQDGADPHHRDPLAHLAVTMSAFPRAYAALGALAEEVAGGRWVALGGGGYEDDVVPRAWAMLFAEVSGRALAEDVPVDWLAEAERATGRRLTARLREDTEPAALLSDRERGDEMGYRAIEDAIAVLVRRS